MSDIDIENTTVEQEFAVEETDVVNYNNLINKPQIGGVTLQGNKSLSDLSLYSKTETNALLEDKVDKVDGKGLSTNDYTNADKSKVDNIPSTIITKISAGEGIVTSTSSGEALISLSSESQASLDLADSSLQPNDNVSSLNNDAGYLTEHQSLANYYNKTETDTLLDAKEPSLPTKVNDRYLHTSSSGELEWSTVSGGGSVDYFTVVDGQLNMVYEEA